MGRTYDIQKMASLPLVTGKRFRTVLLSFQERNEYKIPKKVFSRVVDTKAGDYSNFLKKLFLIEKEDDIIILTKTGKKMAITIKSDDKKSLANQLHTLFIRNLYFYSLFADFCNTTHNELDPKDLQDTFGDYLEKRGVQIPNPSYNSLISLAKMTNLIEMREGFVIITKKETSRFLLLIIYEFLDNEKEEIFPTVEFVESILNKAREYGDNDLTVEELWDYIFSKSDEFQIKFKLGIGSGPIDGKHGLIEKRLRK